MYVIIVFDRWTEGEISSVSGPFEDLDVAQSERTAIAEKLTGGYRPISILKLQNELPVWEEGASNDG